MRFKPRTAPYPWLFLSLLWLITASMVQADLWSLQPVEATHPPATKDTDLPQGAIDRFVLAKLEQNQLKPAADASARSLARRAFFNLTGLPPTPEDLDAFEAAHAKDPQAAMGQLADRLLASPHFGEKWARHWLDLARYADSNGKDRDIVFPDAWRYRDYVINAFNSNKAIHTFFREQIAGDLLPRSGDEQRIASAFLALGPKAMEEPKMDKFSMDMVDEQIDVLSRAMLGITVACARCHDHKSDPISMQDYYAMAGILLSSDTRYGPGPLYFALRNKDTQRVPVGDRIEELHPKVEKWRGEILEKTKEVIQLRSSAYRIFRNIRGAIRDQGLEKAADDPELAKLEEKRLGMVEAANRLNKERITQIKNPPKEQPGYTLAVMRSEKPPADCNLRLGGAYNEIGRTVPRSAYSIPGTPSLTDIPEGEDGRLELADWIANDDNPLTARAFVNRVWHHLFGAGLARTVDNFGSTGESPSHPELLDWLTAQFVKEGWDMKSLVKQILLSRTWQLASDTTLQPNSGKDPENRLLWRGNFRRLDIEAFRDSVLFVSGELELSAKKGSLFQDVYAGMDYGAPNDHRVNFDKEITADRHRTVYLPLARNSMPAFLGLFDFTDVNSPTAQRNSRTIPAQALYLMNNPFMQGRAEAAAKRMMAIPEEVRVETAWSLGTGRKVGKDFSNQMKDWLNQRQQEVPEAQAWSEFMQMLFASAYFRYIE